LELNKPLNQSLGKNRYGLSWQYLIDYQMKTYLKKTIINGCFYGCLLSPLIVPWILITKPPIKMLSDPTCYKYLIQKGQEAVAAGKYEDAMKKYVAARDCPDKPREHDLEERIKAISNKFSTHKPRAQSVREHSESQLTAKGGNDSYNAAKKRYELEAEKLKAERERISAQARAQQYTTEIQDARLVAETAAWEVAQGANSEGGFNKYLEKYPNGAYAMRARHQILALKTKQNLENTEIKSSIEIISPVKAILKMVDMVEITGGTFSMGDAASRYMDEKPALMVQLPTFYLSKYEVTEAEWFAVMSNYPVGSSAGNCATCPIRMVSWQDAQNFIGKLNAMTGQNFRLPTEAEWEYAAKGGQAGNMRYAGSNEPDVSGWYERNAAGKVHPVGQKSANEFGLFDMTGNVREWCSDLYHEKAYDKNSNTQFEKGTQRVFRGGSWDDEAEYCRNAVRAREYPHYRDERIGFRLAQNK
jgi:formylglycine-generating enzyme required for sulfatase activity